MKSFYLVNFRYFKIEFDGFKLTVMTTMDIRNLFSYLSQRNRMIHSISTFSCHWIEINSVCRYLEKENALMSTLTV